MIYKNLLFFILLLSISPLSLAHGVDENTAQFLSDNNQTAIGAFIYIGAKHMLTGYDHLLFLVGVIFFLYRLRDILLYVSFFTLGHSITLIFGVISHIQLNAYLIDAIIAFSIIYKGFDNLGGFKIIFNAQPNQKIAVLIFGLFHGFGLATKLQELLPPSESLLFNLIAFNIGVEIGQALALLFIVTLFSFWRQSHSFNHFTVTANTLLMSSGWVLLMYQLTGYAIS